MTLHPLLHVTLQWQTYLSDLITSKRNRDKLGQGLYKPQPRTRYKDQVLSRSNSSLHVHAFPTL